MATTLLATRVGIILVALILLVGCASFSPPSQPADQLVTNAYSPISSETHKLLLGLPTPLGLITAAVYAFRDQTGQFKPAPSNNLSTAVSQGADTILMKALLDTGWFQPVERSSLQNLLTERQITQTRSQEAGGSSTSLPSVAPANVIIEGSIVAYDFNTRSGGAGAKILGLGSSQQYREDLVSINLRVVNIADGVILHSVNSTKRLFSRQLNNGFFNFVDVDKILELEAGYSYNEPSQLAVVEAIETALMTLIVEGVVRGTWSLQDPNDIDAEVFDRFIEERQRQSFRNRRAEAENAKNAALARATEIERFSRALQNKRFEREFELSNSATLKNKHSPENTAVSKISKPSNRAAPEVRSSSDSAGSVVPSQPVSSGQSAAQPVVVSSVVLIAGKFRDPANAATALARVTDVFPDSSVQLVTDDSQGVQSIYVGPLETERDVKGGVAELRGLGFKRILIRSAPTTSRHSDEIDNVKSDRRTAIFLPYWQGQGDIKRASRTTTVQKNNRSSTFLAARNFGR